MSDFSRGIRSKGFISKLHQQKWWPGIIADRDLFIGVRDDYINVYYRGNSLALITMKDRQIIAKTHYKFLLSPRKEPAYVELPGGRLSSVGSHEKYWIRSLQKISDLKAAAAPFAGPEKIGVHEVIRSNPNIIDVEIALSADMPDSMPGDDSEEIKSAGKADEDTPASVGRRKSAKRIDFAALINTKDGLKLRFFEAKHFSNKELRSTTPPPPAVTQIARYEKLISKYERNGGQIHATYMQVCADLTELRRLPKSSIFYRVADGRLEFTVDAEPRLVVFGYDQDQKGGKVGGKYFKILKERLPGKVIMRGNSNGLTQGISR